MKIQSLNGTWMRKVGMGEEVAQIVPYSTRPVGRSVCKRIFTVDKNRKRIFLKFDGITYHAWVTLNGKALGEMLPYCEYEFEITNYVMDGENTLCVELEDLNLSFGPTPGWENFGGIIRDVSLIYREDNYISDVFFKTDLCNEYKDAEVSVDVQTDKNTDSLLEISLLDGNDNTVLSYEQKIGVTEKKSISDISLWSPDSPVLYTLCVRLLCGAREVDAYSCKVGFRELRCERHRFLLNGKPLFLKGVCKHEMIGDSGHVVSYEQIEEDMKMIKSTGSNFVRLVHYPHCKATVDIADKLGLMVSEEPGLWWSDTANEEVANGSLEVLKRTIFRDRNHTSIVFWLSFNECKFTEQFLIDSANICHQYDPTRLVSGANCMSDEDTLIYFNRCGFDFYTMHPYSATFDRSKKSAQILYDKPLVFTEWGGYFVFDNPAYFRECIQKMAELYHANSDSGALAGAFLWCWADVNDFNRGAPCIDGVLPEGLVTKDRQKHLCYDVFCEEIAKIEGPMPTSRYRYEQLCSFEGDALCCRSAGASFEEMLSNVASEARSLPFHDKRQRNLTVGPRLEKEEIRGISLTPNILADGPDLIYEGNVDAEKITLLGLTGFNRGYPISGGFEDEVVRVKVYFEDGEQSVILRNGREITTVFATIGSSRIDPIADGAPRFASFSYDLNYEQYVINRFEIRFDSVKKIKRVTLSLLDGNYQILIYGVFVK